MHTRSQLDSNRSVVPDQPPSNLSVEFTAEDRPSHNAIVRTGGGFSYDPRRQEAFATGSVTHNAGTDFEQHNDSNVLSTLRSPTGSPVVGRDPAPSDIVVADGVSMTVASAERLGLLQRNRTTGLYDNGATPQDISKNHMEQLQAEAAAAEAEAVGKLEGFENRADDIALDQALASTSFQSQIHALTDVIHLGGLRPQTSAMLAAELGVSTEEQVIEKVENIKAAFGAQASKALQDCGIDNITDFREWAEDSRRATQFKQAQTMQVQERSTQGYRDMAQAYLMELPSRDPASILEAKFEGGLRAVKSPDGQIGIVFPSGQSVSFSSAVKAGLIKVSPASR